MNSNALVKLMALMFVAAIIALVAVFFALGALIF